MNTNNTAKATTNTKEIKYFSTVDSIVHEIINSDDFVHDIVKEVKKATKKAVKKAAKKATKKAAKRAAKKAATKAVKRNNVAEKALEMMYDPMTTEDAIATTKEVENTYKRMINEGATNNIEKKTAEVKPYSMTGAKVDYDDNVEW